MKIDQRDITDQEAERSSQAIPKRVRMAYPELAVLFPLVQAGRLRGESWRVVVDAYTEALSDRALDRLATELSDVFVMGVIDDLFDAFCHALGLTPAVSEAAELSVYQFVATLEERVSGEHLARLA